MFAFDTLLDDGHIGVRVFDNDRKQINYLENWIVAFV